MPHSVILICYNIGSCLASKLWSIVMYNSFLYFQVLNNAMFTKFYHVRCLDFCQKNSFIYLEKLSVIAIIK